MNEISKKTRYNMNYAKEKLKRIPLDVQKEQYELVKALAERNGETVNGLIKRLLNEELERDNQHP